jgi:rhamnose transport system permease protein
MSAAPSAHGLPAAQRPPLARRALAMLPALVRWETLLVALLIGFLIFGTSLSPYFLTATNFSALTDQQMEVALMALPMTLVIISGEIDLSVESMVGLSSALLGLTWSHGWSLWAAVPLVLMAGALGGLLNGLLVTRLGLPSLVVTVGTLALFRGLASVLLESNAVSNFPDALNNFGFNVVPGTLIPWPLVVFLPLAAIFALVLHRSWVGRQLYAIGKNAEAARYSGVRVARTKLLLFVLSGTMASLAGIVLTARLSSARADSGTGLTLDVVTAVLLGGVSIFGGEGTILGVVLAIFVIGELRSGLLLDNVSSEVQSIAIGSLLIFSVLLPTMARRVRTAVMARHGPAPPPTTPGGTST